MATQTSDIVVVGGGTGGCFAAAAAAQEGVDVTLLERKSPDDAGHIACGDAIKGASKFPPVIDRVRLREQAFTNRSITKARFESPASETIEIEFEESGVVVDRKRYGEILLDEAEQAGATVQYDTVVNGVIQTESGRVTGVQAVCDGTPVRYEADVVIDAAGALSVLQDAADLTEATFDTNVDYSQFCSAYREIVETDEPVEYDDTIVFKPTEELGYLWYFPRTAAEINAGVGFQMSEEPMALVDTLRQDLESRPEFESATVTDKLGAALPTRRPYDSAVAPGFMAVGDAAAHVNPTTGGGISGAAAAGHWAAEIAVDAVTDGNVDEAALWEYNHRVLTDFGARFATMDLYNIFGTAHDIDELVSVLSSLPSQQLVDALGKRGTTSMSLRLKIETLAKSVGHWGLLAELYRVSEKASQLKELYHDYPTSPEGLTAWQQQRDEILDAVYDITGADAKY